MSIVLNEHDEALRIIEKKELGKNMYESLYRVARYYIDSSEEKVSKKYIRDKIDAFYLECEPGASIPKREYTLDGAVKHAFKYKAIMIEHIPVSKTELEKIDCVDGQQARRLAFTLLCLAKYWAVIQPDMAGWVKNNDNEIMTMANINTSVKRQCLLYAQLKEAGLIQFSKRVDSTKVKVLFIDDKKPEMKITDMRNLGYQYQMYFGGPFFVCSNCGMTVRYTDPSSGRKQKYCKTCAAEVKMRQNVNSVMRIRQTT